MKKIEKGDQYIMVTCRVPKGGFLKLCDSNKRVVHIHVDDLKEGRNAIECPQFRDIKGNEEKKVNIFITCDSSREFNKYLYEPVPTHDCMDCRRKQDGRRLGYLWGRDNSWDI